MYEIDAWAKGWDVIGDLHGCAVELTYLLSKLGYRYEENGMGSIYHPEGRKLAFVGDITDRGPLNLMALNEVYNLWAEGVAEVVPGNHDNKLWRWLKGNPVKPAHGLQDTIEEIKGTDTERYRDFLGAVHAKHHKLLGVEGHPPLVLVHAGLRREDVGVHNKTVNAFCLYGDVRGFGDDGLPNRRYDWTESWVEGEDEPFLVYGHTVVPSPSVQGRSINIDTGCVFGGLLTAFRWPEREIVQIKAGKTYYEKV